MATGISGFDAENNGFVIGKVLNSNDKPIEGATVHLDAGEGNVSIDIEDIVYVGFDDQGVPSFNHASTTSTGLYIIKGDAPELKKFPPPALIAKKDGYTFSQDAYWALAIEGKGFYTPIIGRPSTYNFRQQIVIDQGQAGLQLDLTTTPNGQFAVAYYKHLEETTACSGSTGVCGAEPDGAEWECQTGIYRDIHNGYTKEALDSSDLEFTWSTNASDWSHEPVDLSRGSGIYNILTYGTDNVPVLVYYNDKHGQINFNRRDPTWHSTEAACESNTCSEGYTCAGDRCSIVITELSQSIPEESLSLTVSPDGRYLVACFDPDSKSLMLAHSSDGLTWTKGIIDSDGTTGLYPTIAINPLTKMPAVAYYRCGEKQSSTQDCHRNYDGVRFAIFDGRWPNDLILENSWKKNKSLIDSADLDAQEGLHLKMAFAPDGKVGLAYTYMWVDPVESKTNRSVMFRLGTLVEE